MSLLDVFNSVEKEVSAQSTKKENKQESSYFELPDGKFGSTLEEVMHGMKAGRPWTAFKFNINYPTEYQGKSFSIFLTLNETTSRGNSMPRAVLEKSVRYVLEIGAMMGLQVPASCFAGDANSNGLAIKKAFEPLNKKGQLEVVKKSKPNPRSAAHPYVDYYFNPFNRGLEKADIDLQQKQEIISQDKQAINQQALQSQQQQPAKNSAQDYYNHTGQEVSQNGEIPFPDAGVGESQASQASQQGPLTPQQQAWGQIGNPGASRNVKPADLPSDPGNPSELTISSADLPY